MSEWGRTDSRRNRMPIRVEVTNFNEPLKGVEQRKLLARSTELFQGMRKRHRNQPKAHTRKRGRRRIKEELRVHCSGWEENT